MSETAAQKQNLNTKTLMHSSVPVRKLAIKARGAPAACRTNWNVNQSRRQRNEKGSRQPTPPITLSRNALCPPPTKIERKLLPLRSKNGKTRPPQTMHDMKLERQPLLSAFYAAAAAGGGSLEKSKDIFLSLFSVLKAQLHFPAFEVDHRQCRWP